MYATSAAAASVLRGLAREKPCTAAKYFVGSVFWNETVDATYLLGSEHQTEGIVADYSLTPVIVWTLFGSYLPNYLSLNSLQGAYSPYAEPSTEAFSYHQGLEEWRLGSRGSFALKCWCRWGSLRTCQSLPGAPRSSARP